VRGDFEFVYRRENHDVRTRKGFLQKRKRKKREGKEGKKERERSILPK
jgi:hypothetical protein